MLLTNTFAAAAALFLAAASAADTPASTTGTVSASTLKSAFALRMQSDDPRFKNKYLSSQASPNSPADSAIVSSKPDYTFHFSLADDTTFDPVNGGEGSLFHAGKLAGFVEMLANGTQADVNAALPKMLPMMFNAPNEEYTWSSFVMPDGEVLLGNTRDAIACAGLSKGGSLVGIYHAVDVEDNGLPPMGRKCGLVQVYLELPSQN